MLVTQGGAEAEVGGILSSRNIEFLFITGNNGVESAPEIVYIDQRARLQV